MWNSKHFTAPLKLENHQWFTLMELSAYFYHQPWVYKTYFECRSFFRRTGRFSRRFFHMWSFSCRFLLLLPSSSSTFSLLPSNKLHLICTFFYLCVCGGRMGGSQCQYSNSALTFTCIYDSTLNEALHPTLPCPVWVCPDQPGRGSQLSLPPPSWLCPMPQTQHPSPLEQSRSHAERERERDTHLTTLFTDSTSKLVSLSKTRECQFLKRTIRI